MWKKSDPIPEEKVEGKLKFTKAIDASFPTTTQKTLTLDLHIPEKEEKQIFQCSV